MRQNHFPHQASGQFTYSERRQARAPLFALSELDPRDVIDGKLVNEGYIAEDPISSGTMRECCPFCPSVPLQLILRYKHVKRSHLLCENCTRCFDALYPDGTSALAFGAAPIL